MNAPPPGFGAPMGGAPAPPGAPGMGMGFAGGAPPPPTNAAPAPPSDVPPHQTLYVNNLNEKLSKEELKRSLYHVFCQFGPVLEIFAKKSLPMRGQAWVVFEDVASASRALREMQGFIFYNKPMRVTFAKEKSDLISKRDGTYKPRPKKEQKPREPKVKKPKKPVEPMAMEEEDEEMKDTKRRGNRQPSIIEAPPNKTLFVQNLPTAITKEALIDLFGRHNGFLDARPVPAKGVAFIEYDTDMTATAAMEALQSFQIDPEHKISVQYAAK